MALLPCPSSSAGFFRACRLGILLFIFVVFATLLQHLSVSASELLHNSATVSGTPHVRYYLRGKLIAVAAAAQQDFVGHGGRNLKEEMSSSFDAESVEVADYSPCANNKHDPSLCKRP